MKLEIVTPESIIFKGEVVSVTLPGLNGQFQLLSNHTAIISALKPGEVRIKLSNESEDLGLLKIDSVDKSIGVYEIKGGILEMLMNKAIVLAE
jgi:F-type H+-transporting ATPase subunit epsilon